VGVQTPSIPAVCFVRDGKVGAPAPKSSVAGSPVSQTHPFGQGLPPMMQSLVQNPALPEPVAQKQAPADWSAEVQVAPRLFERGTLAVVQSPMSVSQP
jgi:hypothetical protein